jgi:oligoendopeptidase F
MTYFPNKSLFYEFEKVYQQFKKELNNLNYFLKITELRSKYGNSWESVPHIIEVNFYIFRFSIKSRFRI